MEAILNYDTDSLHAIKTLIEKQHRAMTEKMTPIGSQTDITEDSDMRGASSHDADVKPMTRSKMLNDALSSAVETLDAFPSHKNFDSSVETEEEAGSQVTDMSESD